jgi:hypothetical protein
VHALVRLHYADFVAAHRKPGTRGVFKIHPAIFGYKLHIGIRFGDEIQKQNRHLVLRSGFHLDGIFLFFVHSELF